jgi:hypothetical protein
VLPLGPGDDSVAAMAVGDLGAETGVGEAAGLRECGRGIGEEIAGGTVADLVLTDPEVGLAESGAAEGVKERGRDVEAEDALALVLVECLLVERVRSLKPGAAEAGIQLERGLLCGFVIEALDEVLGVAVGMKGGEFRGVEEARAVDCIEGGEASEP